ncbi:nucleotidyltransferase domain-containing protein [Actinomadura bangladeshensis]|uniref:Nucleotidyltransferase domain-containing protein n=1 Tax=Actinomadura bangladeshensis TaxID=453573 RepID=A0A4R4NFF0_9ACTN|nr:nucleotidyltransferase domain-containing protein [Actinomadura bangladeshensis]TDC06007.1 nucleotidyltransferase domain-containing protein [Actinomadura bangladeshensis]
MRLPEGMLDRFTADHPYPSAFLTVSGAHLYGFPSEDSDIDLRGVHQLPLEEIVGLEKGDETVTLMWDHDGVEADAVTHDLAKFCTLLLRRNGYVLEQVMSPLVVATSEVHAELKALVPGLVTSNHAHHYLGFARSQWALFERSRELKPLLYTFRVLLTGVHLMRSGEVEADLTRLTGDGPSYLPELIEAKRAAEHGALPEGAPDASRLRDDVLALTARLEDERQRSELPEFPGGRRALHDLAVRARLG